MRLSLPIGSRRAWLALAVGLAACQPNPSAPVPVEVVAFDPSSGTYDLEAQNLTTIQDLVAMRGSVAQFVGGANIVIDGSDPALQAATTDAEVRAAVLKNPGGEVKASLTDLQGVWWPTDYDSESMATAYYNFETSSAAFQSLGFNLATVGAPPVYYNVSYVDPASGTDQPLTDDMAYQSVVGGFLLLPIVHQLGLPLPMNLGLVGHEYSHLVLNALVYGGAAQPAILTTWGATGMAGTGASPAANLLFSVDEGFADLFGLAVTCGPEYNHCDLGYIAASLAGVADARSISSLHCLDSTLAAAMAQDDAYTFTQAGLQYQVGTVIISAVWRAAIDPSVISAFGKPAAVHLAMQTLYDALDSPQTQSGLAQLTVQEASTPGLFTIDYGVANMIVSQVVPGNPFGTALCNAFYDRLGSGPCDGAMPDDDQAPQCIPACDNFLGVNAGGYGECQ